MILIAVDRLTKMVHFIPTITKVTAKEMAELFLRYIFSIMASLIVSCRIAIPSLSHISGGICKRFWE